MCCDAALLLLNPESLTARRAFVRAWGRELRPPEGADHRLWISNRLNLSVCDALYYIGVESR